MNTNDPTMMTLWTACSQSVTDFTAKLWANPRNQSGERIGGNHVHHLLRQLCIRISPDFSDTQIDSRGFYPQTPEGNDLNPAHSAG